MRQASWFVLGLVTGLLLTPSVVGLLYVLLHHNPEPGSEFDGTII